MFCLALKQICGHVKSENRIPLHSCVAVVEAFSFISFPRLHSFSVSLVLFLVTLKSIGTIIAGLS